MSGLGRNSKLDVGTGFRYLRETTSHEFVLICGGLCDCDSEFPAAWSVEVQLIDNELSSILDTRCDVEQIFINTLVNG